MIADGQGSFGFPRRILTTALAPDEIVIDGFAGGGGASLALHQALGREPDVAINHDELAIGMHAANHPFTRHLLEDIWAVDIVREVAGRRVGHLHCSPDCRHFSQAKGGQPRDRATRSLSWFVIKVAGRLARHGLAPRMVSLENVKEIMKWGPLVAKRDKATGRVVRLDGSVAGKGERVPLCEQFLVPDKKRMGQTWRQFVQALRALGYVVEWRCLRACDYGAGTSRNRLFLFARRDGRPIVWPEPTHGPGRASPYVTAADCIDWSIPCRSIFNRPKPLADATLRRIARGIKRYVLDSGNPFIVPVTHHGDHRVHPCAEPVPAITGAPRGEFAVVAPTMIQVGYGEREGQHPRTLDLGRPLGVITAGGIKHAVAGATLLKIRSSSDGAAVDDPLPAITSGAGAKRPAGVAHAMGVVTAFLEQANTGRVGHDMREPVSTIVGSGSTQRLVAVNMVTLRNNCSGADAQAPLGAVTAGGEHHAVVECTLSPEHEAGALRVAGFLMLYYGEGGQHGELGDPLATITTRDRLALVTVHLQGIPYVIVDVAMRMLDPHELYRAQGFPADYVISRTADGRALSKSASVRMVGNSVSPPPMRALIEANLGAAPSAALAARPIVIQEAA